MQITLGQEYNVGEKPTVILYIYINRHAGTPEKTLKTNQRQCSTPSHMVVVIYITKAINTKPLHGCCCILHINRSGFNIRGCQSGTVRGHEEVPRSTGHIMVATRYSDQQGSKSRQKVMRLYKRWHRPITKRFFKPPLFHIESSLDRLGLLSPTHGRRSQQQIGQLRSNQF